MQPFDAPDRDRVASRVTEILAQALNRGAATIRLDDRLVEDLGAESVDLITLVFELEDAFGCTVEDEELAGLVTVRSVVDLILARGLHAAGD